MPAAEPCGGGMCRLQMVITRLQTLTAVMAVQDSLPHVATQLWFLQRLQSHALAVLDAYLHHALHAAAQIPVISLGPYLHGTAATFCCLEACEPGKCLHEFACASISSCAKLLVALPAGLLTAIGMDLGCCMCFATAEQSTRRHAELFVAVHNGLPNGKHSLSFVVAKDIYY